MFVYVCAESAGQVGDTLSTLVWVATGERSQSKCERHVKF